MQIAIVLTFWFQVGLWGMAAVRFAIDKRGRVASGMDPALASSIDIIIFIAGLAIWAMAFLLALDNLGVQIKPLLAGLGIGGIAVALAVQTVLGDLLASMSIALDKPFTVGDSLKLGDVDGTVEHIGVKSTRIRSATGEQVIISNAEILKSRVRNNSRMRERRAMFNLNVAYGTPSECASADSGDRAGDRDGAAEARGSIAAISWRMGSGRCASRWCTSLRCRNTRVYADTLQTVNLAILERFEKMGVEFAFPARPFDPAFFPSRPAIEGSRIRDPEALNRRAARSPERNGTKPRTETERKSMRKHLRSEPPGD